MTQGGIEVEKVKVQICFAGTAYLENVKKQLEELSKNDELEFYCCFLTRKQVEAKGFKLDIVDLLESTLGNRLTFMTNRYDTFDEVMANMTSLRTDTANLVNRLYVLDSGTAKGVAEEISLFTRLKVILMP